MGEWGQKEGERRQYGLLCRKNSQSTKRFRNTWLAESKIKQEAILTGATAKTTCLASLNLLIIIQQNGVANVAFSYFHKGLEVIVLDVFLKAVSRDFCAICTSVAGFLFVVLREWNSIGLSRTLNLFLWNQNKGDGRCKTPKIRTLFLNKSVSFTSHSDLQA